MTCENAGSTNPIFFLVQGLGCNRIRSLLRNGCLIPCNNNYNRLPWFLFFVELSYEFLCVYLSVTVDYAEMQLSTTIFSLGRFFVEMTYEFLCVKLSVTVDYVEVQV